MRRTLLVGTFLLLLATAVTTAQSPSTAMRRDGASGASGASGAVDSLRSLERLAVELRALINLPDELRAGTVGVEIRSLVSGNSIFSLNPDKPLTPASTTKLVTTYTALAELGAGYLVKTLITSEGRPLNGVVKGNLYVQGHGDPKLSVADIDGLVDQLLSLGIKRIEGNIIGDGTFFDKKYSRFEYSGDLDEVEPMAPIAALTIENGNFTVIASSSSIAGTPCNVQTYPHSAAFQIVNTAVVGSAPARKGRSKGRSSGGGVSVALSVAPGGKQVITISGTLAPGRTVSYRYAMKDPPMVIAGMVTERLRRNGVTVVGEPTSGASPVKTRVLAEAGHPLLDILHLVMKNSNNFMAEYVFKMIGGTAGGGDETAAKSIEKIQYRMSVSRVDFSRCIVNDGSGLSRRNCLSASSLAQILQAAYSDKKIFEPLYSLMSIAGVDGTLRKRMRGSLADGNVHGKTGTLRNASALTGYVRTRDGEMLCFGILMNGNNVGGYRAVQDKIAMRLASFSFSDPIATTPVAATASDLVRPKKDTPKEGKVENVRRKSVPK